jgi:hypothetical protein
MGDHITDYHIKSFYLLSESYYENNQIIEPI